MTQVIRPFSVENAPRIQLARLCRQICLDNELRAESANEADAMLAAALTEVQLAHGEESVNDELLAEVVGEERCRIADALVLAEILLPRLTEKLGRLATGKIESPSPLPTPGPTLSKSTLREPKSPLGIADLIDGMLQQEREPSLQHVPASSSPLYR